MSQSSLVQLITAWEEFARQHPEGGVEEFCRHRLAMAQAPPHVFSDGSMPPTTSTQLSKLVGRLYMILAQYSRVAVAEAGLKGFEGFPFLVALSFLGESRKTDIISHCLTEHSTGLDILARLREQGLVAERPAPTDGRAKLVRITPAGEALLQACFVKMKIVADMVWGHLPEAEVRLAMSLLGGAERLHAPLVHRLRGKTLEEARQAVQEAQREWARPEAGE